jgi:hypothetical protein
MSIADVIAARTGHNDYLRIQRPGPDFLENNGMPDTPDITGDLHRQENPAPADVLNPC